MVAKWTAEQFYFVSSGSPQRQSQGENTAPVPDEFVDLQEALAERGVSQVLVLKDIPERFDLLETVFYPYDGRSISSTITYSCGDEIILFDAHWSNNSAPLIYEKDNQSIEIFEIDEIKHYYFTNRRAQCVVWRIDSVEYSISTTLPKEDLINMVNSMYEVQKT